MITELLGTPIEITRGIVTERQELKKLYEEPNVIMMQQACQKLLDHQVDIVSIMCKDKDVLVILTYFYWKLDISSTVYRKGTSTEQNIFDVREAVPSKEDLFHFIVAA